LYPFRSPTYCLILLMVCACLGAGAQTADSAFYSSWRFKKIALPQNDSVYIDTLSIAVGTFSIDNTDTSNYTLFAEKSLLIWTGTSKPDSLHVRYRVLPFSFEQKYTRKKTSQIDSNYALAIYTLSDTDSARSGFVDFNSISYSGSYGRSLSISNSQDVSVNSNFNMQINGYILDSVRIEAALTDNNIPFQPDGNTQQIQEFDRLYITFEKGNHKLTAGDYNLNRPNSYFLNFNKRVQGLFYEGTYPANNKIKNKIGLSGSIAKGQYARNIFMGTEGNQGPYKLTGNNGEQFFIVLAGSEKVYIDGIQMERGEDRDYIINYNTGEISFMPRKMITKDSRIQVEFEYQDRNYLNSLIYVYDELQIGEKWNVRLHAYSNQDAKNQSYMQALGGEQKRFLEGIGDHIDQAFYKNITEDTFAANKILYKIIDTIVDGFRYDSVFVYSTDQDSARYNVGFSYVGPNKGDYIISGYNSNGRSYVWQAPLQGIPQGDYAPITLLITPKKHQLFSIGTTYKPDSLKSVSVELSASNYDPNLFSTINNEDHWGVAGRASYSETRLFGKKDSMNRQHTQWQNTLSYEYVQQKYKAIAPFRDVEFNRDWNVDSTQAQTGMDEQLIQYATQLERQNLGKIGYNLSYYQRGQAYRANRNVIALMYNRNSIRGGLNFNLMHSSGDSLLSDYYRPGAFLEADIKKLNGITIGSRYQLEHNRIRSEQADTLMKNAFSFDVLSFYIKTAEDKKLLTQLTYTIRNDKAPDGNDFRQITRSDNIELSFQLKTWKQHQVSFTGSYRNLSVSDSSRATEVPGETILGRIEYSGNIAQGVLVPVLLYEIGSGQQQKQQFTYVEVAAGQGIYYWIDYNDDGVQQSNEFEIGLYPDQKKYIRIITPTNEYVKANYVNFNIALQFSPENIWRKSSKNNVQKLLSRFSNQLSAQISNRILAESGMDAFNPFAGNFKDEDIISNISSISNTVYFNRSNTTWGLDYTYKMNTGKSLLTYGLEHNLQSANLLKARWTFNKSFSLNIQGSSGQKAYQSGVADDGRTYEVQTLAAEPSLSWILKSRLRITGSYRYDNRTNAALYGGELARIQSANMDVRLSFPNYGSIQMRGTYATIQYDGKPNTSLSFVMLDALKNGNNWLWNLSWERRLGKGIELSLEYDGRAPGTDPLVHTGRMSIRAIL